MPRDIVQELTQQARADGLTLAWCMRYLADALASGEGYPRAHDAQTRQLEREALAVVLYATRRAYPIGAAIPPDSDGEA